MDITLGMDTENSHNIEEIHLSECIVAKGSRVELPANSAVHIPEPMLVEELGHFIKQTSPSIIETGTPPTIEGIDPKKPNSYLPYLVAIQHRPISVGSDTSRRARFNTYIMSQFERLKATIMDRRGFQLAELLSNWLAGLDSAQLTAVISCDWTNAFVDIIGNPVLVVQDLMSLSPATFEELAQWFMYIDLQTDDDGIVHGY
ncbi:hypothetical protein ONS95_003009 [Cadophora gregata]|uniref:uncharacterized protein n=1 Tax=Cadophora gregata TaxID=51156 RepID=UPI0026DC6C37|nr:uncharacterized protein ONS95_003009 [Cadophora gregata]KAK0108187.1 hypothetical protein ONS95_003009 [Cadophora gregata]